MLFRKGNNQIPYLNEEAISCDNEFQPVNIYVKKKLKPGFKLM